MYKLFTVQQATELLPAVDRKLREMQEAVRDLMALREAQGTVKVGSLEAQQLAEEMKFLTGMVYQDKGELDRLGVHVQDLESGLVDFPSTLGAEVVYLCWAQGEDAITHFHRLNQEVGARQPLPGALAAAPGLKRAAA